MSLYTYTAMATASKRTTLELGQDAVYDFSCTPCTQNNLNAEAVSYCTNCRTVFCDTCIKLHGRLFKGHDVLGEEDVAKWGDVKVVTPVVLCDEHRGKEQEMFCEDHDCLCCEICIHLNHRQVFIFSNNVSCMAKCAI